MADFADTIDVVPIGAWHGTGRKAEKGFLSPILLAVYDEDEGVFRSILRCITFSDKMYEAMREFYFRGTHYPSGVGIDVSPQKKLLQLMLSRTSKVARKGWMQRILIKTVRTLGPMKRTAMRHARESIASPAALLRHTLSPMNNQAFGSSL
jgi:hypothetical protein